MLRKADIENLVGERLAEAACLLEGGRFSGAYYLGGYVVELAIKAHIASLFEPGTIPDKKFVNSIYDHNLTALIRVAGLEADLLAKAKADADFARYWEYVAAWSEGSRYELIPEDKARSFVEAVRDGHHGVLQWIKTYW